MVKKRNERLGRVLVCGGLLILASCSRGREPTGPPTQSVPQFGHVFVVVEENHDYSSVIDSSSMPYLSGLANQYGLATQAYGNTHPSIGNYFMLTVGQVITNDDEFTGTITADNIVRELVAAGKTWRSYAEDLPSIGFLGKGVIGLYASRHNPVVYLSDVVGDSAQAKNVVPFSQFAGDLANNTLPQYSFIVPNVCSDAHDCSLSAADNWLRANLAPLIASAAFQQDGLLIITFDEAGSDTTNGGGRVAWVAVSPRFSRRGYLSTTPYQHQSTLRLMAKGLGLTTFPGAAASAPDMAEFFAVP